MKLAFLRVSSVKLFFLFWTSHQAVGATAGLENPPAELTSEDNHGTNPIDLSITRFVLVRLSAVTAQMGDKTLREKWDEFRRSEKKKAQISSTSTSASLGFRSTATPRTPPLHQRDLHFLPSLHLPTRMLLWGWRSGADLKNHNKIFKKTNFKSWMEFYKAGEFAHRSDVTRAAFWVFRRLRGTLSCTWTGNNGAQIIVSTLLYTL